jgi:hypothetical protein
MFHTAEQIDHKLDLINENKNLLPYPYQRNFQKGLEDVGDGSILTTERAYPENSFVLNDCALAAGKYTVSLDITTVLEEPTTVSGFVLKIEIDGKDTIEVTDSSVLTISEETAVVVSLIVPSTFDTGLLIKPQIEKGEQKTSWVPNMDKIGTYIDRRFNGTNIKIADLNRRIRNISTGSMLPDDADSFNEGDIFIVIQE